MVTLNHVRSFVPVQMCLVKMEGKDGVQAPGEFLVNFKHLKSQDLLREGDSFVFVSEISETLGICVIKLMPFLLSVQLLEVW